MAMTPQEMFDKVAIHILTQGRHSLTQFANKERCMYRLGALRCAAGCLITDEAYDPVIEGARVNRGSKRGDSRHEGRVIAALEGALVASGVDKPLWPFLSALQHVHDALLVKEWPAALTKAAASYNVNDRVVTAWGRNR